MFTYVIEKHCIYFDYVKLMNDPQPLRLKHIYKWLSGSDK